MSDVRSKMHPDSRRGPSSSSSKRHRRSAPHYAPPDLSVLVVSEDPLFIHTVCQQLQPMGVRVTGCLGPLHSRCSLDDHPYCPLALNSTVALVDSPLDGSFTYRLRTISSVDYAEHLQEAHPQCAVLLCGASADASTTKVTQCSTRTSALALLCELVT